MWAQTINMNMSSSGSVVKEVEIRYSRKKKTFSATKLRNWKLWVFFYGCVFICGILWQSLEDEFNMLYSFWFYSLVHRVSIMKMLYLKFLREKICNKICVAERHFHSHKLRSLTLRKSIHKLCRANLTFTNLEGLQILHKLPNNTKNSL